MIEYFQNKKTDAFGRKQPLELTLKDKSKVVGHVIAHQAFDNSVTNIHFKPIFNLDEWNSGKAAVYGQTLMIKDLNEIVGIKYYK